MNDLKKKTCKNCAKCIINEFLDDVELSVAIVICRWREAQLFAHAEGRVICEQPTSHDILREPSSIIVLSFFYKVSYDTL